MTQLTSVKHDSLTIEEKQFTDVDTLNDEKNDRNYTM